MSSVYNSLFTMIVFLLLLSCYVSFHHVCFQCFGSILMFALNCLSHNVTMSAVRTEGSISALPVIKRGGGFKPWVSLWVSGLMCDRTFSLHGVLGMRGRESHGCRFAAWKNGKGCPGVLVCSLAQIEPEPESQPELEP